MAIAESSTFADTIIFSKSTPYQRIVVTRNGRDFRLFLNGNLQFSSRDEYRYHEALVHPGMASLESPKEILVLGGGDGMAVRELLKYPSVEHVVLVDLDKSMTDLFSKDGLFSRLNKGALQDKRVSVINDDAFIWLRKCKQTFDFIVIDFPDPSNFSLGKLYTDTFYKAVKRVLNPNGIMVVQSTSPYYARNSFWCVVSTLNAVGLSATPYHAYVPSFGDWGYVIASHKPFRNGANYPPGLRYISADAFEQMKHFTGDMQASVQTVNKLNNQSLVHLFESEWGEYVDAH